MRGFTAHCLGVSARVLTPVTLNEHKGSALRGALYHALRGRFCALRERDECATCPLWQACPVCTLVSTLAPDNRVGPDAARPYTIQPPLDGDKIQYRPGEVLAFGLTLYAEAMRLFPYVIMALKGLEQEGLGRRTPENGYRRGALRVERVWAENPLSGERHEVLQQGDGLVQVPDVPVTHEQVLERCAALANARSLRVMLLTPTRLTQRGRLVKPGKMAFATVLARLLDRLESLAATFTDTPLELDFGALVRSAAEVRTVAEETRWVDLRSYSTRQRRATPIGGLVGSVAFSADDWRPYLPWLVWGQFTHVGKDAVKGDGWYRVRDGDREPGPR
jgi:hypothetical protein